MKSTGINNVLQKQGWLRVLIFCVVYSSALLGLQYGLQKKAAGTATALPITALLFFLVSMACVFIFRQFVDKKSFVSLGFRIDKRSLGGFFLALFVVGTGTLLMYYTGHLSWSDILPDGSALGIALGSMVFIAVGEETVFRGYILQNLLGSVGPWIAIAIQALLFCLFHLGNPGVGTIPLVNLFLGGGLMGLAYVYTKNLWFPILFHLAWDFFQGPILGFRVSGIAAESLLQPEFRGEEMLTGGSFGFEGSLFATALLALSGLLLYLLMEGKLSRVKQSLPVPDRK